MLVARGRIKGIGHVFLRGQILPVQVTPAHGVARDGQLTGNPHGQGPLVFVHDVDVAVAEGLADGHRGEIPVDLEVGHVDGGLGGAVGVDEGVVGRVAGDQLFPAHGQGLQIGIIRVLGDELPPQLGGAVRHGDLVFNQKVSQAHQVQTGFRRHDEHAGPGGEVGVEVLHGGVKTKAPVGGSPVFAGNMEIILEGQTEVDQVGVGQHDALGLARGPRGVEQGEEVVRRRRGQGDRGVQGQGRDVLGQDDRALEIRQQGTQVLIHDDDGGAGVLQHVGQPLLGVGGVQGLAGAAGLEDADGADREDFAAVHHDAHRGFRADAQSGQGDGQPFRQVVQVPVGQGAVLEDHRRPVRRGGELAAEQIHHGQAAVEGHGVVVEAPPEGEILFRGQGDGPQWTVGQQALQDHEHEPAEIFDGGIVVEIPAVLKDQLEIVGVFVHIQGKFSHAARSLRPFHEGLAAGQVDGLDELALVHVEDVRGDAVLGGQIHEGTGVVLQGAHQGFPDRGCEIGGRCGFIDGKIQGQGAHQHAHGVAQLWPEAAAVHGAEQGFLLAGGLGQGVGEGAEEQIVFRQAQGRGPGCDGRRVHKGPDALAEGPRLFPGRFSRKGFVGNQVGVHLHPGQNAVKIGRALGVLLCILEDLAVIAQGKGIHIFIGQRFHLIGRGNCVAEQAHGGAVGDQMVEVAHEDQLVGPLVQGKAEQGASRQVEGGDEIPGNGFIVHGCGRNHRDIPGKIIPGDDDRSPVPGFHVDLQEWEMIHRRGDGRLQPVRVDGHFRSQPEAQGGIVLQAFRLPDTIQVNAQKAVSHGIGVPAEGQVPVAGQSLFFRSSWSSAFRFFDGLIG